MRKIRLFFKSRKKLKTLNRKQSFQLDGKRIERLVNESIRDRVEAVQRMEIRQLEIDFDNDILKINGTQIKDRPVQVSLPGPDGWELKKVFNHRFTDNGTKECDLLNVIYEEHVDKNGNRIKRHPKTFE